tara:strand:- start:680 stop:1084 length:405 start_codon:yes stop_codon:yes gene_type:complete
MTTVRDRLGVPSSWTGSIPEYLVYNSLTTTFGLTDGIEFSYQSAFMGGRLDKGGVILDFFFYDPPDLAINVQGEYYHYGLGVTFVQNDIIVRQQMAGQGINLIFIDESDILDDVDYYVKEAFNYKDHSQLGGGR